MGVGKDDPPALVADPLEQADHVALAVAAVAIGKRLVAELERAEEDHAAAGVRKEDSDRPLRAVEEGEMEPRALCADPADVRLVSGEDGMAGGLCAELDDPAVIVAGGQPRAGERRVGIEQRPFARDGGRICGLGRSKRLGPCVAPVADAGAVVIGDEDAPIVAGPLRIGRRHHFARARAAGQSEQDEERESEKTRHGLASSGTLRSAQKPMPWHGRALSVREDCGARMKKAFYLTGLALLAAPVWAAQDAPPPASAPAATPAPTPAIRPTREELEASRLAIDGADVQRLLTDRAYAAGILVHLDRLASIAEDNPEARLAIDTMRLLALITQERPHDIRASIDDVLAQRPSEAHIYAAAWLTAVSIEDFDRAVAAAESASRNIPGVRWAQLRAIFERDTVGQVLARLHRDHQEDKRARLAQALFRIGWPGSEHAEMADYIRSILMDDRLRQHDGAAAASYAAGIVTPSQILPMIVQTRYDPVLAPGRDRMGLLRDSLAQRDLATAEALAAAPQDARRVLDRVQLLRSLGRSADALALITPFTRDVRATAASEDGKWLINEGAYALLELDRKEQAVALMRRLVALPIARDGSLISQFINHAEILSAAGRHAEALDHARMLERDHAHYASDFGKMWISSAIVCALAGLNRSAEAGPQLERMRALSDANPAALTRAYLCVGDDEAAAALMVHRLQSDDPESAVLALQNYALSHGEGQEGPLFDRLTALRERPAVRDALARVGHVLTLPLARTYWGGF